MNTIIIDVLAKDPTVLTRLENRLKSEVSDTRLEWADLTADQKQKFEEIAKLSLRISTLETRNRDQLDFYDVSVWSIREALLKAYELGKQEKPV